MRPRNDRYSLDRSPFFKLSSRSRLASLLKVTNGELRQLGLKSDSLYAEFGIPKPQGGVRDIEDPARHLKGVQSRLAVLLSRIEPSESLFCPVKGRSYVGNATRHIGNDHVHCLDIKKFYPSVSSRRVFYFFESILQCKRDIAALLTGISTYKGHLPTGSPLSPILAYFCFSEMWERIERFCAERSYTLSIYVDDITISSAKISMEDVWAIKMIIASYGLSYHKERDFRGRPAVITGCVVSGRELGVPHTQQRKRRLLLAASRNSDSENDRAKLELRLSGLNTQMGQIRKAASRL